MPKRKDGIYTSEFWLTLAVLICATLLVGLDKIDQNTWGVAVGLQGGGYAVARGLAKRA